MSKLVKVERKGTYQGVPQWGITDSPEKTPSRSTAVRWAALEKLGSIEPGEEPEQTGVCRPGNLPDENLVASGNVPE